MTPFEARPLQLFVHSALMHAALRGDAQVLDMSVLQGHGQRGRAVVTALAHSAQQAIQVTLGLLALV